MNNINAILMVIALVLVSFVFGIQVDRAQNGWCLNPHVRVK